ncbi:MAG TPA: OsmC family protein [Caulobacteraceae bacterium]|jgi:osmotically inducible protein OsmC|nr:OsmC family protein [Caulobacteraceae bacterium]
MPTRTADAEWTGAITEGSGRMRLGSGTFDGPYSFKSRMQDGAGTNPEELLGAAHAGCFSMALSAQLTGAGLKPERIHTTATVNFTKAEAGWTIDRIDLATEAKVPGLSDADFQAKAADAKKNCPVSRALAGVDIRLTATLL